MGRSCGWILVCVAVWPWHPPDINCRAAEGAATPAALPSERAGWVIAGRWRHGKEAAMPNPAAQLALAEKLERAGSFGAAAAEYEKLARTFPESAESERAYLGAGRCRFLEGRFREAAERLAELRRRFPKTELLDAAAEMEIAIGRSWLNRKGEGSALPPRKRASEAQPLFERILRDDPMSRWADDALLGVGLCLKEKGLYDAAVEKFRELIEKYPWSELKAEAEMRMVECAALAEPSAEHEDAEERKAMARLAAARDEAAVAGRKIDEGLLGATERMLMERRARKEFDTGMFYERNGRRRAAELRYELILARYPGTEWAAVAKRRLEALRER